MSAHSCDVLIIGSGQAGNPLAQAMADAGRQVILVEEAQLGGSCVNYGCVPTKMLLASATRAHEIREAAELGVEPGANPRVDMAAVVGRKDKLLAKSRRNIAKTMGPPEHPNITLLRGHASFEAPHKVQVQAGAHGEVHHVEAKQVFINVGTHAAVPDVPGLAGTNYFTTTTLLDYQEVPEHLLILGGGYIGLEYGQMFRRFGSQVTIIESGGSLLEHEDDDVCDFLQKHLTDEYGLEFILNAETTRVSQDAKGRYTLAVHTRGGERQVHGTHLLVATGRKPNTDKLGLEEAGIKLDEKGYITVNTRLETNVADHYALGDVHGGPQFTHLSYDDYRVVRDNLLHDGHRSAKQRALPYTVFTTPQLGRVGLSETQAKDAGVKYRVTTMESRKVARAQHTGQTAGFWKGLVGENDKIVGAAILSQDGGEIMTMFQLAMMGNLRYQELQDMVIAHPLWAEGLNNVWKDLE
jgi:pyruvate/2-oxoglutarate dehydrogenase complex dihydrolipoamide dehydrogenase (E3) component